VWSACRSSGPEVLATCGLEVTPVADPIYFQHEKEVLGIRVSFWCGSGSGLDPALTPDPTPFSSDLKDAINYFFIFFIYNLPAGTLSLVLKILFFDKILR
jgi:hypothetical protein